MKVLCECGAFMYDPANANVVIGGVPRCPPWTCDKVKEHAGLARPDLVEHESPDLENEKYDPHGPYLRN